MKAPRPKKEGDQCRRCLAKVIRKDRKPLTHATLMKTKRPYFYLWHLVCPSCGSRYSEIEEAKVYTEDLKVSSDQESLF